MLGMKTFNRNEFRSLLGDIRNDPDPTRWLVAADYVQENGEDKLAAKWRLRANHFEALKDAVQSGPTSVLTTINSLPLLVVSDPDYGYDQPGERLVYRMAPGPFGN